MLNSADMVMPSSDARSSGSKSCCLNYRIFDKLRLFCTSSRTMPASRAILVLQDPNAAAAAVAAVASLKYSMAPGQGLEGAIANAVPGRSGVQHLSTAKWCLRRFSVAYVVGCGNLRLCCV